LSNQGLLHHGRCEQPLLSPVFRDEDGAPRELIGHGALQAENKLSGASCQERLIILSEGGDTLALRKHNVSSCTWLNINPRAKAGLWRYILSHAEEQEEGALNMGLACQGLVWPNKAISRPFFVSLSKTRWQCMSGKIALSVLSLYWGHSCTEKMRASQEEPGCCVIKGKSTVQEHTLSC